MTIGGGVLGESVTISGRTDPLPGASVDFRLYGPDDLTCSRPAIHATLAVPYPQGGGTVQATPYTPVLAGAYRWLVSYSGEANNPSVVGVCGAANQTIVDRATPSIVTAASPGIRVGSGTLADTAVVTGRVNPQPGATIDFTVYGPDDASCSGPVAFALPGVAYPASGAPTVTTVPAFTPSLPGTYRWKASYGGDANNVAVSGDCGDPAETVVVTPAPPVEIGPGIARVDADADGFDARVDCDDRNPSVHPGAVDKPGNAIDEDCVDGTAYSLLPSTITLQSARLQGSRTLLLIALTIRPAVAGSTLRLSCAGGTRSCRGFRTTTRLIAKSATVRTFSALLPTFKLRPGATFEVRVTKPSTIGRVLRLRIFARKQATRTSLCLAPGTAKPATCP